LSAPTPLFGHSSLDASVKELDRISLTKSGRHSRHGNERIVFKALDELLNRRDSTAIDRYWRDPYIQHAPLLDNGVEALRAAVRDLPAGFSYQPGLVMSEGDEVVVHSRFTGIAPTPVIVIQIFRLDHGKIVEHRQNVQWDVPADQSANSNPMTTPRVTARDRASPSHAPDTLSPKDLEIPVVLPTVGGAPRRANGAPPSPLIQARSITRSPDSALFLAASRTFAVATASFGSTGTGPSPRTARANAG
jgi:predicted SnoaL-like aldol condensation-catalyzing enzyme